MAEPRRDPRGQRAHPAGKRPPTGGSLRWLAWGAGALGLTGVAVVAAVTLANPGDMVRRQLIASVKAETGRTLSIDGAATVSLSPLVTGKGPAVILETVRLGPPPGMAAPATMTAAAIKVSVALWPLLSQRVVIEQLDIERPEIDLRIDPAGRMSWELPRQAAALSGPVVRHVRLAQAASPGAARVDSGGDDLAKFAAGASSRSAAAATSAATVPPVDFGRVRLRGGRIAFLDERSGRTELVDGLDLDAAKADTDGALAFDGHATWRGDRVAAKGTVKDLMALIQGQPSAVAIALAAPKLAVAVDGQVTPGASARFAGPVDVKAASLAEAASWLGADLPNAAMLGAAALTGQLAVEAGRVRLERARATLGTASVEGSFGVQAGPERPDVVVDLVVRGMDADRLRAGLEGARMRPASLAPKSSPMAAPSSITDLLRGSQDGAAAGPVARGAGRFSPQAPSPQYQETGSRGIGTRQPEVRGFLQRDGWSSDRIDMSALSTLDVSGKVSFEALQANGVKVDTARTRVALAAGKLDLVVHGAELYGGRVAGSFTATPKAGGVIVSVRLATDKIALGPLVRDAGSSGGLEGQASVTLALVSGGRNEAEIMQHIKGKASVNVADGAVFGWDVGQIINGLGHGELPSSKPDPAAKTPFKSLNATFDVDTGVARTKDMKLDGASVSATGAGAFDIGQRALDLRVEPRLSRGLLAPGSTVNLSALEAPMRVQGPMASPKITIESVKIGRNEINAIGAKVRERFKGQSTQEMIDDVKKNGANSKTVAKAKSLLKDLFGK